MAKMLAAYAVAADAHARLEVAILEHPRAECRVGAGDQPHQVWDGPEDAPPDAAPVMPEGPRQRLVKLVELRQHGLIDEDEYQLLRTRILEGI